MRRSSQRLARDGVDGLHLATEIDYEVVVLDILLPGLDGFQVCASLRAAGRTTPILMLTAKDGDWDLAEGLDTGADDYLVKPFRYPVRWPGSGHSCGGGRAGAAPCSSAAPPAGPARHRCWREGKEVELTPREFSLLTSAQTPLPFRVGPVAIPGATAGYLGDPTSQGDSARTITFQVTPAGSYQYVYPVPGHARMGMHGTFTVR